MNIIRTTYWAIPPKSGNTFRIGRHTFRCYFTLGPWALVKHTGTL